VAVVEKVRIKIIVKEVIGGQKIFWSVIPFWRMYEYTNERKLHDGDIEEDEDTNDTEDTKEKPPVS